MMYHKTICFIVLIKPLVVVAVNLPPPPQTTFYNLFRIALVFLILWNSQHLFQINEYHIFE